MSVTQLGINLHNWLWADGWAVVAITGSSLFASIIASNYFARRTRRRWVVGWVGTVLVVMSVVLVVSVVVMLVVGPVRFVVLGPVLMAGVVVLAVVVVLAPVAAAARKRLKVSRVRAEATSPGSKRRRASLRRTIAMQFYPDGHLREFHEEMEAHIEDELRNGCPPGRLRWDLIKGAFQTCLAAVLETIVRLATGR